MLKSLYTLARGRAALMGGPTRLAAWSAPPGAPRRRVQKNLRGEQLFPPRCFLKALKLRSLFAFLLFITVLSGPISAYAAPPGTVISNQASLDYLNNAGQPVTMLSNEVRLVTAVIRSPANVQLTRLVPPGAGLFQEPVGPSACFQSGTFVTLADPVVNGQSIDPSTTQDLSLSRNYNLGEPIFIRLDDSDQNVDAAVVDYATVTLVNSSSGDSETVRLRETGIDTGIFAGYLPSGSGPTTVADCVLQGTSGQQVEVRYTDPADPADSSNATAGLDPLGLVFDSQTGSAVNGALIELVDDVTGQPAVVYGNDGISLFPSSISSGQTVTDSGGTSYLFAPGQYRFPVVAAGNYRIVITPPSGFGAPSEVAVSDLQQLPNAPFILSAASFGNAFNVASDGPFGFDVPVDPLASTLFIQKSTVTTIAAPGDFVRYELVVENTATASSAPDVRIVDSFPSALRFVPGSVLQDGAAAADPLIDGNSMQMQFSIGTLDPAQRMTISYVAEIVGGTKNQELVNTAVASDLNGLTSNVSQARIRLTEDLFRSSGTLIGRIVEADCSASSVAEDQGVAGVRVYLEDGRYAVTDSGGRFHFEGLKPGGHVAQLDPQTVPEYFTVRRCETAGRFAGRGDSQFVEMTRGSLLRADFYLQRKAAPEGRVHVELQNAGNGSAEEVSYSVTLRGNGNVAIDNLNLMVMLPDGVSYKTGSLNVDGAAHADPRLSGQSLLLPLADRSGNWRSDIAFDARIASNVSGELRTRALARFDSPIQAAQQTPVAETLMVREPATSENAGYVLNLQFDVLSAELSASDRAQLDQLITSWRGVRDVQVAAVGHSDSTDIAPRNQHLFADNYVLSRARANAVATYIASGLDVPARDLQVEGRGADDPLESNETDAGRQANRRVELILSGQRPGKQSFVRVKQASSGTLIAETKGLLPGSELATAQMVNEQLLQEHLTPVQQVQPHINSLPDGIGWVLPEEGYRPAVPAMKIAVRHGMNQKVALFINGLEANPLNFDGIEVNTRRTVAVSTWAGVDLLEGPNNIVAEMIGPDGLVVERLLRTVHYAGAAVRGELMSDSSVLVADGRVRPVFAVRLFDRFGQPARQTSIGAFRVDAPYRAWWQVENDRENKIVNIGSREPLYTIGRDGIALIELEPTTDSGLATLHLKFEGKREQEIRGWLEPEPRDWILVGFGEGTAGYSTLSRNATAAIAAGQEDGFYQDGRLAFFAKGQIKGEYLLTMAFDSARDSDEARQQFLTNINPNDYYTLYGDETEQRFEAPSQRKLFVKLERQQFLALFGDFNTGLSMTELTRYERRFNGLKSEYQGDRFSYNVFASETDQSFIRDELQGDGTSGLYRLSNAPIIGNSETVRIEIRDRFDSAQVLSTETLNRFLDYNIDYLDGTIFFKKPVPSRDAEFNLVYIVAEYESASNGANDLIAGGRAALHTRDKGMEVGVSYIDDGQQAAGGDLTGVDIRWQASGSTIVRAEIAESNSIVAGSPLSGNAESISVEHRSENLDLRAFYKDVDQNFGLGQQSGAERGIRKYGLDGRLELNEEVSVNAQATQQENLETGAERRVANADLMYSGEQLSANVGLVYAEDEFLTGETRSSNLVDGGISQKWLDSALTVRANGSFLLGGEAENGDYLSTIVVGADYELLPGVDVFTEFERADGKDVEATMTRVGLRATPWHRAQFNSSISNEMHEFGPRLFANIGLVQGLQISDRWAIDFGVDQTKTIKGAELERFDDDRELASGTLRDDFVAVFLGAMYQAESWSTNSRVEYRDSDNEQRTNLLSGWYRESHMGHGMSAGLALQKSDRNDSSSTMTADLRMGWAYRVAESSWSFLDRIDLIYEDSTAIDNDQQSWRLINNFNANRRLNESSQLSLQYAFKYVRSEFGPQDFTGYTDLIGVDFRKGFRQKWDAGINTSTYHSYQSKVIDYGVGLDVGFNVRDNMWLTLGYNFAGFHDSDFSAARYTAEGPYLRISIKADQQTLKDIAGQR